MKTQKNARFSLHTEIVIEASVDKVWTILMDFDSYPEWNPFVKKICGNAEQGAIVEVHLQQPDGMLMRMKPRVTECNKKNRFSWLGHLFVPGLFDGEHLFELESVGVNTRFVQRENFNGILVGLFRKMLETKTQKGFTEMNEAIKRRAECVNVG